MIDEDVEYSRAAEGLPLGPVYVVAADPALRESLTGALQGTAPEVTVFASVAEVMARIGELAPGCIVSGLCVDSADGSQLLRELAGAGCPFPVVALAPPGDVALAVRAMKAGAVDVVALPVRAEDLAEAVRGAQSRADGQGAPLAVRQRLARLTRRERQVLEAMVRGDGNKAIAHGLGISPRTVEVHRAKVMEKLSCRSLPDIVRLAVQAGLLLP